MFCESLLDATLDGLMPRIPRHRVKPRPLLDLRSAGCGGLLQGGLLGLVRNRGLVGIARSRRGREKNVIPVTMAAVTMPTDNAVRNRDMVMYFLSVAAPNYDGGKMPPQ